MAETKLYKKCWRCNGVGKLTVPGVPPGSPPTLEDPCVDCLGTGIVEAVDQLRLDPEVETKIDAMIVTQTAHTEKLGDIMDKCNDIKEKVNEIMDKLNE